MNNNKPKQTLPGIWKAFAISVVSACISLSSSILALYIVEAITVIIFTFVFFLAGLRVDIPLIVVGFILCFVLVVFFVPCLIFSYKKLHSAWDSSRLIRVTLSICSLTCLILIPLMSDSIISFVKALLIDGMGIWLNVVAYIIIIIRSIFTGKGLL